jgi:hypothetical protein
VSGYAIGTTLAVLLAVVFAWSLAQPDRWAFLRHPKARSRVLILTWSFVVVAAISTRPDGDGVAALLGIGALISVPTLLWLGPPRE